MDDPINEAAARPEEIARRTYDVAEAGQLLGIGRNQAYEAARSGAIGGVEVIKVGRRVLVPKAPFDRMLEGKRGQ